MVFQRDMPIRIFGEGNGHIIAEMCGVRRETENTTDGKWLVELPSLSAGGPYTLKIVLNGEETLLEDIMVGDVWLCGGQSNMEHILCRTNDGIEAAENCRNENIRLFTVPRRVRKERPIGGWHFFYTDNEDTPWKICDTDSALYFSAIGFHFARNIQKEIDVPIGMIDCNRGGTNIETYVKESVCRSNPAFEKLVKFHDEALSKVDDEKYEREYEEYLRRRIHFARDVRTESAAEVRELGLRAAEMKEWVDPDALPEPYGKYNNRIPGTLYASMVERITPFAVKGVLWYQGESNADRANKKSGDMYRDDYDLKYAALMQCWRDGFKCPNMPFYAVELAPYKTVWDGNEQDECCWAYIREMQMNATKYKNSYLVPSSDNDDGLGIHPINKKVVADRLSNCALKNTYGRNKIPQNPSYKRAVFKDGKAYIEFNNGEGLYCAYVNPYLRICGEDKVFRQADVAVENDRLVVWNNAIKNPVAVRYCYSDYFIATVFNGAGLPLHPFRTDDYPIFD